MTIHNVDKTWEKAEIWSQKGQDARAFNDVKNASIVGFIVSHESGTGVKSSAKRMGGGVWCCGLWSFENPIRYAYALHVAFIS